MCIYIYIYGERERERRPKKFMSSPNSFQTTLNPGPREVLRALLRREARRDLLLSVLFGCLQVPVPVVWKSSYYGNKCQDHSLPMPTQTRNPYPLGVVGKVIELSTGDYLQRLLLRVSPAPCFPRPLIETPPPHFSYEEFTRLARD